MKWYISKLIYQIICGDGQHTAQFDEQLRVIHAEDDMHAFQKARLLGHREEDSFLNNDNKPVHWKFIDVCELHQVSPLIDGAELYSRIHEQDDAAGFKKNIYRRATHLLEQCEKEMMVLN